MDTSNTPLLRPAAPLAIFWFLIMGALGVFFPYYGLYLRENIGLQGVQIGAIFATLPLVGFFVQPLWGIIADRSGLRIRVLTVLAGGTAAGYFLLGHVHAFFPLLLATALFAGFSRALIPAGCPAYEYRAPSGSEQYTLRAQARHPFSTCCGTHHLCHPDSLLPPGSWYSGCACSSGRVATFAH